MDHQHMQGEGIGNLVINQVHSKKPTMVKTSAKPSISCEILKTRKKLN